MTYTQLSKPWKIAQPTDFHVCFLHQSRFVAHKQKYCTTSLRIFLPLRLYSRLNDFLNTCRKRKTAIGLTAVLLRLVSVRNTQYHSIQSHRHRLECYSSILSISSYPLLSVLPLHPASLPFPLSDIPPYSKRFRRIPTIKDVMYSLTCDAYIMTKITEDT